MNTIGWDSKDWTFDFTVQPYYTFSPGGVINANAATFPAMTGTGMTMAILNLGPCSMLPPHYHPRATNVVVAINGTTRTYMLQENGAKVIQETLTAGKMTIFPQASMHMMYNMGCEPAQLVSALNCDDAGTNNIFNVMQMDPEYVATAMGDPSFNVNGAMPPPPGTGAIWGSAQCLEKCGIKPPKTY